MTIDGYYCMEIIKKKFFSTIFHMGGVLYVSRNRFDFLLVNLCIIKYKKMHKLTRPAKKMQYTYYKIFFGIKVIKKNLAKSFTIQSTFCLNIKTKFFDTIFNKNRRWIFYSSLEPTSGFFLEFLKFSFKRQNRIFNIHNVFKKFTSDRKTTKYEKKFSTNLFFGSSEFYSKSKPNFLCIKIIKKYLKKKYGLVHNKLVSFVLDF